VNVTPPGRGFGFPNRSIEIHHGPPGAFAWVVLALQILLVLGVAWLLVSMLLGRGRRPAAAAATAGPAPQSAPLETLQMRYARGEIDRDAYLRARADLGGPPPEASTQS
jgi:uncharacterized membrane protein